jgi:hypothetical protein
MTDAKCARCGEAINDIGVPVTVRRTHGGRLLAEPIVEERIEFWCVTCARVWER